MLPKPTLVYNSTAYIDINTEELSEESSLFFTCVLLGYFILFARGFIRDYLPIWKTYIDRNIIWLSR